MFQYFAGVMCSTVQASGFFFHNTDLYKFPFLFKPETFQIPKYGKDFIYLVGYFDTYQTTEWKWIDNMLTVLTLLLLLLYDGLVDSSVSGIVWNPLALFVQILDENQHTSGE